SLMIFPEAPAALALIYAFRHLVVRPLPRQRWRLLLIGLAMAGLPWLNPRFVLVSGSLALLALVALWRGAVEEAPPPSPLPIAMERGSGSSCLPSPPRWGGGWGGASAGGLLLGPLPISALLLL